MISKSFAIARDREWWRDDQDLLELFVEYEDDDDSLFELSFQVPIESATDSTLFQLLQNHLNSLGSLMSSHKKRDFLIQVLRVNRDFLESTTVISDTNIEMAKSFLERYLDDEDDDLRSTQHSSDDDDGSGNLTED